MYVCVKLLCKNSSTYGLTQQVFWQRSTCYRPNDCNVCVKTDMDGGMVKCFDQPISSLHSLIPYVHNSILETRENAPAWAPISFFMSLVAHGFTMCIIYDFSHCDSLYPHKQRSTEQLAKQSNLPNGSGKIHTVLSVTA
jgi:hypothetical protein